MIAKIHRRFEEFRTYVREEFVHHLPFTIGGVMAGLALAFAALRFSTVELSEKEFHLAHFAHLFFSGAASAAIFRSYRTTPSMPVNFKFSATPGSASGFSAAFRRTESRRHLRCAGPE